MKIKNAIVAFFTIISCCTVSAQMPGVDSMGDLVAQVAPSPEQDGPAILYRAVAWGNAVDYGSSLVPVGAYESLATCVAAKHKLAEPTRDDDPKLVSLVCRAANTANEKALHKALIAGKQHD